MQLTLVESVGKKADFCRHVIQKLGLEGVQVVQERAETLGQMPEHRQQYDWALARAVAVMNVLVEYLLPLARIGGAALALKGENAPAEAHAAEHATRLLGGHLRKLIPVTLPGVVEDRYLVVIDKVAATPNAYPRRVGMPSKHPLQAERAAVMRIGTNRAGSPDRPRFATGALSRRTRAGMNPGRWWSSAPARSPEHAGSNRCGEWGPAQPTLHPATKPASDRFFVSSRSLPPA